MSSRLPRAQVLVKAMMLLEVLLDGQPHSVSDLARRTQINRTTVHRLLATLEDFGLVQRDPETERIRLGLRFLEFARVLLEHSDLRRVASPYLRRLSEISGETAYLTMLEGDLVVYIDLVESPHAVRLQKQIGATAPLHCTAAGKALLAELDPRRVRTILARTGLPSRTNRTIRSIEALEEQLAAVRAKGYAVDLEEDQEGVCCVASAIREPSGPRAALVIAGPAYRLTPDLLESLGAHTAEAAREVARQLGFPTP